MWLFSVPQSVIFLCRKEAKEFLDKQRETSDARVRAHRDGGGCGSKMTTPSIQGVETESDNDSVTVRGGFPSQPSKKTIKLSKKGKTVSCVSTGNAPLPSLGSPLLSPSFSLSPEIMERCRSVEVRLTKCAVGRGSEEERGSAAMTEDVVTISTESETDSAVKASQFYSSTTGHNSTSGQLVSRKKKKKRDTEKTESRKKVGTDKNGEKGTMRSSSTSRRDSREEKRQNTPRPVEDDLETEPLSVSSPSIPSLTPAHHTTSRGHSSTGTLKSELFGDFDSDTDCVILSSPCSSGEEEIMNISFEDALRGVEGRGGRGRRISGKRTVGVSLRGRGGRW